MMNKAKKNSLIYLAANVCYASIPFMLMPYLVSKLEPDEYGSIAAFQVLVTLITAITGFTVRGTAARKYYEKENDNKNYASFVGTCFQLLVIVNFLVFCCFTVLPEHVFHVFGFERKIVLIASLTAFANSLILLRLGQWQIRHLAIRYGAFQVARSALDLLATYVLIAVFLFDGYGRILSITFSTVLISIIGLTLLSQEKLISLKRLKKSDCTEILHFGLPMIPHVVALSLFSTADRLFISAKLGLTATGVYFVAFQISSVITIIYDAVNKAMVPILFENLKDLRSTTKFKIVNVIYLLFFLTVVLGFLLIALVPYLGFFLDQKYSGALEIAKILIFAQLINGLYFPMANLIIFSKKTKYLTISTTISVFTYFTLLFSFTETISLTNVAYSFCFAMALRVAITSYFATQLYSLPWFKGIVLLLRKLVRKKF